MRVTAEPGIEQVYREHALSLTRFALVLTGDRAAAEDLVQDAFLGLHRHWGTVQDQARVVGYLRTAVVNGNRSRHRRHLVAQRFRAAPDPPVWSAEAAVLASEDRRALLGVVARLPRRQREVLALKYFLDLSEQDIAAILGITRGAVASTGSRALAALARQLGEGS
jgi:RNA polymerase sigma-70 factor (sigma-E family)